MAALHQSVTDIQTISLQTPFIKRAEIAQQILITFSGAPPYPKIDGERLRVRPRLPHSNKHGRALKCWSC